MNKNITREVMEQYETIRKAGPCNMFDFNCVQNIADQLEMCELASLEKENYIYIISNFSALIKKYDIKQ